MAAVAQRSAVAGPSHTRAPPRPMPAFLRRIRAAHHADDEDDGPASAAGHETSDASTSTAGGSNNTSPPGGDSLAQSQLLPPPPPPPPRPADEDPTLVPPDNFAMVSSFVYRSSFPKKKHFEFLKTLGLKSVL
jgi:hypothetical protein